MVGLDRRLSSIERGYRERNGSDKDGRAKQWYKNLLGAMGELAFAKGSGLSWSRSVNAPKGDPDVLPNWQVRTRSEDWHDLIVRGDDDDDALFALMIGQEPVFIFGGWIRAKDAKLKGTLEDKGERNSPAYWVSQKDLLDL